MMTVYMMTVITIARSGVYCNDMLSQGRYSGALGPATLGGHLPLFNPHAEMRLLRATIY